MYRTSRLALVSLSLAALIAVGCSSGSSDDSSGVLSTASATTEPADATTTTPAPPTTVDPTELATAYADFGPYPVGVTTLQLAKGPKVEVWYPAVEGTGGTETYDVREFTPEVIRALLTGDASATYSYPAGRDAEVAEGTYPVVLFSHGFTGIRVQSAFLTSHLASWGMIVAAPDHPSRDLPNVLGGTASGDRNDSVDDLLQTLDLVVAEDSSPTSVLSGHVDADKVVAVGHSAGGGTIVGAAADDRVDGYVSMASGVALGSGDSTATTVEPQVLPDKPSFFLAGSL
ncbi:MAG: chlorophyllase/cutinase-like alpha/beta fold protein, partial [Ilumatobacteraceae bacterium]